MKKLVLWLVPLFCFTCFSQSAQEPPTFTPLEKTLPTSPEAALFKRFGDIPIGYYTGTANISIPLYTIQIAAFKLPIELRYHSSGIKVADEATWVGLGWDLSPGGEIIQEVRGSEDKYEVYHLNADNTPYSNFMTRIANAGSIGSNKFLNQIGRAYYELFLPQNCNMAPANSSPDDDDSNIIGNLLVGYGDPDIYHYNFGDYSGKFYINPETNQVVVMDKKKDIKFESLNSTGGWKATTIDGTQYIFNTVEKSYDMANYYPYGGRSGSTIKLTSILLTNDRSINFEYVDAHSLAYSYLQRSVLYTVDPNDPDATSPDPPQKITSENDIKILSRITSDFETIDFNLEGRDDIYQDSNNPIKRLKSVDITSAVSNKNIKSIDFSYSYFPYNFTGAPMSNGQVITYTAEEEAALGKRLKLNSIHEIGYDASGIADATKPAYQFEYDTSVTMPLKNSYAVDFYGYYNGVNNSTYLPDLDYFEYSYQYSTLNNNALFTYNYSGANRYTNNNFAKANLLKKVIYPTGGYSEFEYEPNTFTNQFIPNSDNIGDLEKLTTLEDKNYSTDVLVKTFHLSRSTTITFENTIHDGYIPNMASAYSYDQMMGSKIQLVKTDMTGGTPNVTILKIWDLSSVLRSEFESNHGITWNEKIRIPYDSNPNVSYTVSVYLPSNLSNNSYGSVSVRSKFHYYDETGVDTSVSAQCGMRIKSIKNYSESAKLASHKLIQYSNGKLLNRFSPIITQKKWYYIYNGGTCADQIDTPYTELSITSDLIKQGGNLIGYGNVDEFDKSTTNETNIGKTSFHFYNSENGASPQYPVIVNSNNGNLLQNFYYDSSNNLLKKNENTYDDLNGTIDCFYGLKIIKNFTGNYDPLDKGTGNLEYPSKYSYLANPLISQWNMLTSTTTTEYLNGASLVTQKTFTYNDKGSLRTEITTNSDGKVYTGKYFYPSDSEMSTKPYRSTLVANHRLEPALLTQRFEGSNKLSELELTYGGNLLPYSLYQRKGNSLQKKITFDVYDNYGDLEQYTVDGHPPVAIIWGYNSTLPVTKVDNALYSDIVGVSNLRSSFPQAFVTTYTYDPLIGVTSITDPNGKITNYVYDPFGRLEKIVDNHGKIISQYNYHFKQ